MVGTNAIAAAYYGGGLWYSTDSGVTWINSFTTGAFKTVYMVENGTGSYNAFAGAYDDIEGLWFSTDAGASWVNIVSTGYYNSIYINNNNIIVGGINSLLYSSSVPPTPPTPYSNICFPAGTPIKTDQGIIAIDKIDITKHTIGKEPILCITKTLTLDPYLIYFNTNAIERNYPTAPTVMSKDHKIIYKNHLVPAYRFLNYSKEVKKVKYSGEVLYNVVLSKYGIIRVNNLECETLHPDNIIAKLYRMKTQPLKKVEPKPNL
jgi:uncharacterized protein YlbG (UPF0298 family)